MTLYIENAIFVRAFSIQKIINGGGGSGKLEWGEFKVDFDIKVDYPLAEMALSYKWNDPSSPKEISCNIKLKRTLGNTGIDWMFACPLQTHKKCKRACYFLYLGENKKFSCYLCAKARYRRCWIRSDRLDFLIRNPTHIKKIMESPFSSTAQKRIALEAYERASRELDRIKRRIKKEKQKPPWEPVKLWQRPLWLIRSLSHAGPKGLFDRY